MFLLVGDVLNYGILMAGADRENAVPCLPVKPDGARIALANPSGCPGFDFLDQIRHGNGTGQREEHVNMAGHGVDGADVVAAPPDDAADVDVTVQINSPPVVDHVSAFFGTEDQMHENIGE